MKAIITQPPYKLEFTCVKKEDGYYTHAGVQMQTPFYFKWVAGQDELLPGEQAEMFNFYAAKMGHNDRKEKRAISAEKYKFSAIVRYICDKKDIPVSEVKGVCRKREVVYCRHLCFYIAKHRNLKLSLSNMGRELGGKDHTTVIHAVKAIEDLIFSDPTVKQEVDDLLGVDYFSEAQEGLTKTA